MCSFFRLVVTVLLLVTVVLLGLTGINSWKTAAHNTVYVPQNCYVRIPDQGDPSFLTGAIPKANETTAKEVELVEVLHEVPLELDDWATVDELERFLAADDTDTHVILAAGPGGVVQLDGRCQDIALQLRNRAMARGKYLSVQILHAEEYYKWYGRRLSHNTYHAVCMAKIGQSFYIIEPDTDEYWLAYSNDKPE